MSESENQENKTPAKERSESQPPEPAEVVDKKSTAADQNVNNETEMNTTEKQTLSSEPELPTATKVVTVEKPKTGRALSIFAILLSLFALAGSGFTWFQTQVSGVQEESRLAIGVSEIGGQVSRLGDSIAQLQREQADVVSDAALNTKALELKTELGNEIQALAVNQQGLAIAVESLNKDLQRGVNEFLIEEVSQLLRLANNSVLFDNDIESAISALQLADEQLKGLRDPRYSGVRNQINSELATLAAIELVDLEALSAKLHAVTQLIPELPLANEPEQRDASETPQNTEQELTFRGELVKIWRDLIGSISIQRVDQPPKPLLVPEQRYFLNENIQLALSKAELALLKGEADIYQRSLQDAERWLRDYFDLKDSQVSSALEQINSLLSANIRSDMPPITGSYQALQSVLGGQ